MKTKTISRRKFIEGIGVSAVAAPHVLPSSVLGADGHIAPHNRITMICIGMGGQGRQDMNAFLRMDDVRVVGVCDVDKQHLKQAKNLVDGRYGNQDCGIYTDFREALEHQDVDTVLIATPDHWHATAAIAAVKAGKDVYGEKPLTHNLVEGRALCNAVQRYGRVWQTGSQQRVGKNFQLACELVRNGYIGKVHHMDVSLHNGGKSKLVTAFPKVPDHLDYNRWVGPAVWAPYHHERCHGSWRSWMDFGGGQLMDWIGHHGDIAHMGMDYDHTGPVEVEGKLWQVPPDSNLFNAPFSYEFLCKYADGATMRVASRKEMPKDVYDVAVGHDIGIMWYGENGRWIWVGRPGINAHPKGLLQTQFGPAAFRFKKSRGHHRDFIDCVKTRERTVAHVEAGHRSASIGHLGKIACMLKAKLKFDPDNERFIGNDQANRMLGQAPRAEWMT